MKRESPSASRSCPIVVILAPIWLLAFSVSVLQVIPAPVVPRISEALQLGADSMPMLGLLGTSFSLPLMVFALIAGVISDRIGRRKIILIGSAALATALLLYVFAVSLELLFLCTSLSGMAAGMLTGSFVSYVGDYFPYEKRGVAMGWVMSGFAAGFMIGVPAGTILADAMGYRAPFVFFGVIVAVGFGLAYWLLPDPGVELDQSPFSVRHAAAKYWRLATKGRQGVMVVCYFLMYSTAGLFVFFLPTWLEQDVQLSSTQVASLFFVGGIILTVMSPLAGRLSDAIGRRVLVVCACLGTCLFVGSITFLVTGLATAMLFFCLAMMAEAFRTSPMQALMSSMVESQERGAFFALCNAIGRFGFGCGSGLAGWLYLQAGYVSNSLAGALFMLIVAILCGVALIDPGKDSALSSDTGMVQE